MSGFAPGESRTECVSTVGGPLADGLRAILLNRIDPSLERQDGVSNAHVRVLVRNNGRRANDTHLVAHAP